jgi:hypothetical protein
VWAATASRGRSQTSPGKPDSPLDCASSIGAMEIRPICAHSPATGQETSLPLAYSFISCVRRHSDIFCLIPVQPSPDCPYKDQRQLCADLPRLRVTGGQAIQCFGELKLNVTFGSYSFEWNFCWLMWSGLSEELLTAHGFSQAIPSRFCYASAVWSRVAVTATATHQSSASFVVQPAA